MKTRRNLPVLLSVCIAAVLTALLPVPGLAQVNWICGDGTWDDPNCWSTGGQPVMGDSVFLNAPGANVTYQSGPNPTLQYVEVAGSGPGSSLNQTQDILTTNYMTVDQFVSAYQLFGPGSLIVNNNLTIGASGDGYVTQDAGSVSISGGFGALTLGRDAGATGEYNLNGGTLTLVGTEEYIGNDGTGRFNQWGGAHELNGVMYLGVQSGGVGTYQMDRGSLTAGAGGGDIVLGEWGGTGTFVQNDGTVNVDNLTLARQAGARGEYQLTFGDLTTGQTVVGGPGMFSGDFSQSGGTHTTGLLVVGPIAGGSGMYSLYGGVLNGSATVGDAGLGLVVNSGGTHNVTGDLILGNQGTGSGNYSLVSDTGSLTVSGSTIVGNSGWGKFFVSAGTHTTASLVLGQVAGGIGVGGIYDLSGTGSVTVSGTTIVGNAGEGTFNQSGGTHTTGSLTLGTQFGGTGTYNLSGGDLTTSGGAVIGEGGRGIVNQSGGRYSTGSVVLGRTADR